jgi:hypothetical protein
MAEPHRLITGDRHLIAGDPSKMSEGDRRLLNDVAEGRGEPMTVEQLEELMRAAQATAKFMRDVIRPLSSTQASRVSTLWRDGHTMRSIARRFWLDFGMEWEPPDNQMAGWALLERTDQLLGTHHIEEVTSEGDRQLQSLADEARGN